MGRPETVDPELWLRNALAHTNAACVEVGRFERGRREELTEEHQPEG